MNADDGVGAQVDADWHVVQPLHSVDRGDRLRPQVVVTAGFEFDRKADQVGSETDPQSQKAWCVAASGPQVDRAQLGTPHQVGHVRGDLQPFDPFCISHRFEPPPLGEQAGTKRTQLVGEVASPRTPLPDHVGAHHDR